VDPKAREELIRDLLHSGFLLVAPELNGKRQEVGHFRGPNMQGGHRFEVVISVTVKAV
jgi:hypothetical protein